MNENDTKDGLRHCEYCKAVFKPIRFWQKFCNRSCRQKNYWSKKIKEEAVKE